MSVDECVFYTSVFNPLSLNMRKYGCMCMDIGKNKRLVFTDSLNDTINLWCVLFPQPLNIYYFIAHKGPIIQGTNKESQRQEDQSLKRTPVRSRQLSYRSWNDEM